MFHLLLSHPLSQITDDVTRTVIAKQPWLVLNDGQTKIILTGGNPQQLMQLHDRQLFCDQKGVLTQKFRLKVVPAVIPQQGRQLLISEIHLPAPGGHGDKP